MTTEVMGLPECWDRLRGARFGRLATCSPDGPEIFPVNHLVDHGSVVFRTDGGSKLRGSAGRRVAFEVDGIDASAPDRPATAWSVVVTGRVREVLDVGEAIDILGSGLVPWQLGAKAHLLRIEPTGVSGRRFAVRDGVTPQ